MTDDCSPPKYLRAALATALFPRGVVAVDAYGVTSATELFAAEAESVTGAVYKRKQEFAAGRSCARLALSALGCSPAPLRAGPDRAPVWPKGVTGSISHTTGYCIAAVARKSSYPAIGVDAECIGRVTEDLWHSLFVDDELLWLYRQPESERAESATILFGAKESFYKLQYSLTQAWLGFKDVCVSVDAGRFVVVVREQIVIGREMRIDTIGRYVRHGDRILCGMVATSANHEVR
jgi:4'-phosphopantetheinyl transferase EntD